MRYLSPLRYPGGKARLAPYLARLLEAQGPQPRQYAEPFAGGAGAALHLLRNDSVERIHLNDLNPGIAAFWRASLDVPNQFCHQVRTVPLTIDEWHRQAEIYANPSGHDDFELGFATFYLNRTNRSGILDARPIGGFEQLGHWKIDARFNRESLCTRIQAIADLRHRIYVTEYDALAFLNTIQDIAKDVLVYADPPYLVQGEGLYLHAFDAEAHLRLARFLASADFPWILTYDDDPRITNLLYSGGRCATFDISHTAHRQHVGTEAVIYSEQLVVPDLEITTGRVARWTA
ncbi:DNA adenine methylase [Actinopolyspora alba]|uniref:site-specific DNA-methyltransferase (adenine-specific) n=1 Tax=Actinopolyspora alba TaxID=673379 RepID=A0A1I1YSQ9_9ACTN|nr:DNA adenine methylase [Actinopolyspora alba]SFE22058.1 DNA adenine methylase [Actinopolyspora alba]